MSLRAAIVVWVALAGCVRSGATTAAVDDLPDRAVALATDDPAEVLASFASHPQPGLRSDAVRWQVWAGLDTPPYDPNPWVQRAWVEGLVRRGEPVAEPVLVQLAATPDVDPWVRCLAALVKPGPEMRVALESYTSEALAWRRVPLALGAWVAGDADAETALAGALSSGVLDWNVDLLIALGHHGTERLEPAFAQAIANAEPELQLPLAAMRLAAAPDPAPAALVRPFTQALNTDDVEARLEVVDLLIRVHTPASTQLLEQAAASGPALVTAYAELAGLDRGTQRLGVLERAVGAEDPEVRELAMRFAVPGAGRALYEAPLPLEDKRAKVAGGVVRAGLADPDPRVRREALRSAARLDLDVRSLAGALARDADPRVRIAAAGYLAVAGR